MVEIFCREMVIVKLLKCLLIVLRLTVFDSLLIKVTHDLVPAYIFRLISFPSCLMMHAVPTPDSFYYQEVS